MSGPTSATQTLLVAGGCGGLVGRAVLEEFGSDHRIVSVHRHRAPNERTDAVRWKPLDVARVSDWASHLEGVEAVLILAWYRSGSRRRFERLGAGLERMVEAVGKSGVRRLIHLSVPDAPARLETDLPYLYSKRRVDAAIERGPTDYSIVRPTMLYGAHDRLLTVMLHLMHRYERFPMFGDGRYHVSPLAARDLARILRRELASTGRRNVTAGGPRRWVYRELTDRMFSFLDLVPRYVHFSPRNSIRLARFMEAVGSSKLYAYEAEWLLSDMLGLEPYVGLDRPLSQVDTFLQAEAARLRGFPST